MIYAEVIGDPIAHSKSPIIHGFWLDALKLYGAYRTCHVTPEDLAGYFEKRTADPDWRGCNVTLPHKQAVFDHIADPGDVKRTIDALGIPRKTFYDKLQRHGISRKDFAGEA